ncbi:MAG: 6-pyruvoyl-tetrahydropterin synthase-related protein, partial [bacterium]|nr:6-pyruvoyl-tetrahydropterin synthase-related protein [bacterium]
MKYILLIIALSFIVIIPLLLPGFILTHDMYFPLFRLYGIEQCVNEGQIPPRWVASFALGYGYPFFNFYAPLAYYIAYLFHFLGLGYVHSIHATIICGFLLGGIGTYFWVRDILQNKFAALVSAIVYVYFPYRLVQVYVRGDISEFIATAFFPWVLFFFNKLFKEKFNLWYFLGASLTYAAVILSHNIMAMVFSGFLLIYFIFSWIISRRAWHAMPLLSLIFGLGLSAYFWIPALAEKQFVSVDSLVSAADYRNHFVSLFDLLNPRWGFGGSELGAVDRMSVQLGVAPILLSLTSLFLVLYLKPRNYSPMASNWFWFSWVILLILIFLMLPISKPVWSILPMAGYILYPWRLLALTALPLALLSGNFIILIRAKQASPLPFSIIAIIITIALSAVYLKHRSIPVPENEITPVFIWNCESAQKTFGTTMSNEYLPQTVSRMPQEFASSPISVIAGDMNIQPQTISGIKRIWNIEVKSPGIIRLNTFNFPGWQVKLDGKNYAVQTDGEGRVLLAVSNGKHQIKQIFRTTPIQKFSNYFSLLSFLLLIIYSSILYRF